ncbi:MAG: ABC transporter ATP-binding protein [Geobacteraceae bacterium]|nr:ABC transporter ATP-binding protein [Geobacteraceae bacterium]
MSSTDSIISIQDLKVELGGVSILDIPCFFIREKEFVSLIGPNGSGKSTLLLAVNCLLKRTSGRLVFRGHDVATREDVFRFRRRISMVFQEPLLFDTTVYKNVASGLKIRGMGRDEIRERVVRYLQCFNIEHLAHRSARKLSGGEAQRTSLARAFAVEPEVIFLDEPFSALDPPTRQSISDDLETIVRESGTTVVMVTHDQSEALRMSDRIVVMKSGRIVQEGTPLKVMNNPVNEFVASFVGMECMVDGRVMDNNEGALTIDVQGKPVHAMGDLTVGSRVYCGIRPENVTIEEKYPGEKTSARNIFPARVESIASVGPFLKLTLDCGFPLASFISRESFASLGIAEGKEVVASFKATAVHLIRERG